MKKPLLISLLCVFASLGLLIWGFATPQDTPASATPYYVLILQTDTGTFFMQLRKGLQDAATEYGARILIEPAEPNPAEQAKRIAADGAHGVLLWLEEPAALQAALRQENLACISIGQPISGESCILPDDEMAGKLLMQRALLLSPNGRIALLRQPSSHRAAALEKGALQAAEQAELTLLPWPLNLPSLSTYDVLIASDASITQALAEGKQNGTLPKSTLLVGVDAGESSVYHLEEGHVHALTMNSSYAMGYRALNQLRFASTSSKESSPIYCPPSLIDLQNMYLDENVKLVFPLLQ